jgi:hypothetical protein
VAEGGSGDDTFSVYSNQAVLRLEGDDGNDLFTVRAFALAQTDPVTGDIVWIDPVQEIAQPRLTKGFSTAAETAIRTGAGNNQVEYNINAPVSVDGGAGFDKLVVLGTEFADHIVVTDKGIFGAGLTVTYQNIEVLEVDALEGDDTIDVLSTPPGMAVRVIGNLGNDTVNASGDVAGDVVSRDIKGTSSTINHRITTDAQAYKTVVPDGISLSVARPTQGQVIIDENLPGDLSPGSTDVTEGAKIGMNPADDIYGIYLGHAPAPNTFVYVTVSAAMNPQEEHVLDAGVLNSGDIIDTQGLGDSILLATGNFGPGMLAAAAYDRDIVLNGQTIHVPARAVVVVFDQNNWKKGVHDPITNPQGGEQFIHVMAVNDKLAEGDRTVAIGHTVLSTDPTFDHAIVRNVQVTVHDNDQPAVVMTQLDATTPVNFGTYPKYGRAIDNTTKVLEGDAVPLTFVDDYFAVELATAPTDTVRVAVTPQDNRVSLSSSDARFHRVSDPQQDGAAGVYYVTFNAGNWDMPVFVTMHAVQRGSPEDPHDTSIVVAADGGSTVQIDADTNTPIPVTSDTGYKRAASEQTFSPVSFAQNPLGDTITRNDGGNWTSDGFVAGQNILISGTTATLNGLTNNALFTIKSVSLDGQTLTLTVRNTVIPATGQTMKVRVNGSGISQTFDALVIDDGEADLFTLESGGSTVVTAGTAKDGPGAPDTYTMRLTQAPQTTVNVDVITDGQTDINQNSGQITLQPTGFVQNLQPFKGNLTLKQVDAHTWTITRATGSELGSWIADGFMPGQTIRIQGTGVAGADGTYVIASAKGSVTDQVITLTDAGGAALPTVPSPSTFNSDSNHSVTVTLIKSNGVYNNGNVVYTVAAAPFLLFSGNIAVAGNTITRNDIGSFVNDNFAPGEIVQIQDSHGAKIGNAFYIGSVTDTTMTLFTDSAHTTPASFGASSYDGVSIFKLLDTLRRTNGTSWLDSGFFEGQLVRITGLNGAPMYEKVDLIIGSDPGKLDIMVFTDHPASVGPTLYSGRPISSVAGYATPPTNVSMIQMAARVEFDSTGGTYQWYTQATIPVIADPYFDIQPGHQNLRAFPKSPHRLSGIRGPLAVEGGTTSADRSLVPAVLLPGEANGPFFNIPLQPPETQSIDTLNVYNDGTKGVNTGTLTSTALTGLNMNPQGLDFTAELGGAHPFGESGKYPGGISYGSIVLVQDPAFPGDPTKQIFSTDGSHSTFEVVNIFLGQGNDRLDINSTLIPGPDHNADGTLGLVSEHGGITTVHGGGDAPLQLNAINPVGNAFDTYAGAQAGTYQLVRTDGLPWVNDGFAVGQQVLLSEGSIVGSYTIIAIGNPSPANDPNASHKPCSVLTLLPAAGAAALVNGAKNQTGTISVTDQLAVVSGRTLGTQTTGNFDVTGAQDMNRVVRDDGLPWANLGFAVGQQVAFAIGSLLGTRTVLGFDNTSTTSGFGSVLSLSGAALTAVTNTPGVVAVSSRKLVSSNSFARTPTTITRNDAGGNWIADGFAKGQAVAIGG